MWIMPKIFNNTVNCNFTFDVQQVGLKLYMEVIISLVNDD